MKIIEYENYVLSVKIILVHPKCEIIFCATSSVIFTISLLFRIALYKFIDLLSTLPSLLFHCFFLYLSIAIVGRAITLDRHRIDRGSTRKKLNFAI